MLDQPCSWLGCGYDGDDVATALRGGVGVLEQRLVASFGPHVLGESS